MTFALMIKSNQSYDQIACKTVNRPLRNTMSKKFNNKKQKKQKKMSLVL